MGLESLFGICLLAAVLELDFASVGQWGLSRPIVLGPVLGYFAGSAFAGVQVGILVELLCLDDLPMGSYLPVNGAVAASLGVILSTGGMPLALALPAAMGLGLIYRRLEKALREHRSRWNREVEERTFNAGGKEWVFGRVVFKSLVFQTLVTFVFLFGSAAILRHAGWWAWCVFPLGVRQGLAVAVEVAVILGLANLVYCLRPR